MQSTATMGMLLPCTQTMPAEVHRLLTSKTEPHLKAVVSLLVGDDGIRPWLDMQLRQ
jgi:hypothetical protein